MEFYGVYFKAWQSQQRWKSAPTPEHEQQSLQAKANALDFLNQIADQDIVFENKLIKERLEKGIWK